MTRYFHQIGSLNRIAIPIELMKKYRLKVHDYVIIDDDYPNGFVVLPAKIVPVNESFVEDNQHTNSEPHT